MGWLCVLRHWGNGRRILAKAAQGHLASVDTHTGTLAKDQVNRISSSRNIQIFTNVKSKIVRGLPMSHLGLLKCMDTTQ